jgi:multicomponent Na+:H+ antiporter subunit D
MTPIEEIIQILITHSPALMVAVPLLGAFITPLLGKTHYKARNIFVILVSGFTCFLGFLLANDVFANGTRTYIFGAKDISLPVVRILFEVDGMSGFMAIIACLLPLVAVIYSWAFMKKESGLDKYYTLILLMSAGMIGMVLTGDMFNFFVFLEITSIASCALIAFWTGKGSAVQAGFKYIVISSIGALFVLFAIAIFYGQYNALNMAVLANSITYSPLDQIALVLLLVALALKAGIVPMHMWLPDAYGRAPSSVTLVLIATTQASLYGVFRVCFTLYGKHLLKPLRSFGDISIAPNTLLSILIVGLALLTIFIGVLMALKQTNFKRMIAFAAIAEIGYMFLAVGAAIATIHADTTGAMVMSPAGQTALKGGLFHIINDALDVGLLFLVAGAVFYAARHTSLNKLGGLARNMKYTTVFFLIGLLAVAGMPPMNGFASKIMIYQSTFEVNPIIAIIAILCSILLLAVFVKVFHSVFLGPKLPKFKDVKEVPRSMLVAMGIIACIIVFIGLFPDLFVNNIVKPAADALFNHGDYIRQVVSTIFLGGA